MKPTDGLGSQGADESAPDMEHRARAGAKELVDLDKELEAQPNTQLQQPVVGSRLRSIRNSGRNRARNQIMEPRDQAGKPAK